MNRSEGDLGAAWPGAAPVSGVSTRFAVLALVGLIALVTVTGIALDRLGRASRSGTGDAVETASVSDSAELLDAWESAGVHGRILVHASKSLGFRQETLGGVLMGRQEYPLRLPDTRTAYRVRVTRENRNFVAANTGHFRAIRHLMPVRDFRERVEQGRKMNLPGIAADGNSVVSNDEGFIRHIAPTARPVGEPVVLEVDASYFGTASEDDLIQALDRAGYTYTFVLFNYAADDAEVTDEMRERLAAFEKRFVEVLGS